MAQHERRNSVALDDAYFYCRQLEAKTERPTLFKVCNAIRTLDLALEAHAEGPAPVTLTTEAWQRVRDSLFDILVSNFSGSFIVYPTSDSALPDGSTWPETGILEFYPERTGRKNDSYTGAIERMAPSVVTPMRWRLAQGEQDVKPSDFTDEVEEPPMDEAEQDVARALMSKFYEICEEQASEGKKKAHRKWWQLYWEANACPNKRQKHELQKQMVALQSIWGTPTE
jgi:hypothetical protein